MYFIFVYLFLFLSFFSCNTSLEMSSRKTSKNNTKLVVGVVVDQMRFEYLNRFKNKYSSEGFLRLINQGYSCNNHHFNYIPTITGPGHASIFSGTTPSVHGIIGNDWYDKIKDKTVYCTTDNKYQTVGADAKYGKVAPTNLKVTTVADQNRIFTQMRGKTVGVSIKDRGAVFPSGHTANGAYWFEGLNEGKWVTSSYYMDELPEWVKDFNTSSNMLKYLKTWNTYYDINLYQESGPDNSNYEKGFNGKTAPVFPYDLKELMTSNEGYDIIKTSPFGNTMTTDFALSAIEAEGLGDDEFTDFLTISYSSTDYVGHDFGLSSVELQDTYLRLDLEIERLLNYLDQNVGKGNYTLFLTADHGAAEVPAYLSDINVPGSNIGKDDFSPLFDAMKAKYRVPDLIKNISNNQVFLNHERIRSLQLTLEEVQKFVVNKIIDYSFVSNAYTATTMQSTYFQSGLPMLLQNGYNQKLSGDVLFALQPGVIVYGPKGTTHGSGYSYDTHVPLLFYGNGINNGISYEPTSVTDIAPTISALLGISFPSGATGTVIEKVIY
ncbi:MAG: alkaline phosphatase family protein [Formosa sp.]|jgi:predicted AlkP superfamily pyrophosphatase or phosphodiesterase|nr:alkaline phosphatase family protein [Formosa sp.]|tara:strand:+ start:792 stop:2438 length:1647 start_codon:yes stop_codon:yes gene_type:complete